MVSQRPKILAPSGLEIGDPTNNASTELRISSHDHRGPTLIFSVTIFPSAEAEF
jgi:hypothetical protein